MKESNRIRSAGTLIALSILMILSGMVVMVSADGAASIPNEFYGTVTIDGADAPAGTVINAYIDGKLRGTIKVTTAGEYGVSDLNYLKINGSESEDGGKTITFTVDGAAADHSDTEWHDQLPRELDLTADADVDASHTDGATFTADRTISDTTICPGSTFTVTIDLDVTGSPVNGLSIAEDLSALPSDWTVSPNDGGVYNAGTKKVGYIWFDAGGNLGDQTVTYEVTVPGTATIGASYDITGEAAITPPDTTVDIGTDTVMVLDCGDTQDTQDTQDASPDGAAGSAPTGSDSDEAPKPGPVPDATISASEENVTSTPSEIPTTQTTSPSTPIKKPGEESKEGFLPGFEAVFAIAGFLAVVCLVRRRR